MKKCCEKENEEMLRKMARHRYRVLSEEENKSAKENNVSKRQTKFKRT